MDIDDLKQVNGLWKNIYPYLVSQIMEHYHNDSESVLELGPFSGGISRELAKLYPGISITIAEESPLVVNYLKKEVLALSSCEEIKIKETPLNHLIFNDFQFELVVFRGAFFFLDKEGVILREIFRILKKGGMAFVGGGYGKDTPEKFIREIANESRLLNDRLGRRRVSLRDMEEMLKKSKLTDTCRIEEEGGLWLIIRK